MGNCAARGTIRRQFLVGNCAAADTFPHHLWAKMERDYHAVITVALKIGPELLRQVTLALRKIGVELLCAVTLALRKLHPVS